MKGMKSAQEGFPCPPPGADYIVKIVSAEATTSTPPADAEGDAAEPKTMLKLVEEIRSPEEYAGTKVWDTIITDGTKKGGGFGKGKLRGLGIDVDSSDDEIPDEKLAEQLLGAEVRVAIKNDPVFDKNPATGKYDLPRMTILEGKQVQAKKPVIAEYLGAAGGPVVDQGGQTNAPEAPKAEPAKAAAPTAAPAPAAAAKPGAAVPPWKAKAQAAATGKK